MRLVSRSVAFVAALSSLPAGALVASAAPSTLVTIEGVGSQGNCRPRHVLVMYHGKPISSQRIQPSGGGANSCRVSGTLDEVIPLVDKTGFTFLIGSVAEPYVIIDLAAAGTSPSPSPAPTATPPPISKDQATKTALALVPGTVAGPVILVHREDRDHPDWYVLINPTGGGPQQLMSINAITGANDPIPRASY